MTRAFTWKPRWAVIRRVNSLAMSTFEPSSEPEVSEPAPPLPGVRGVSSPLLEDGCYRLLPAASRPCGLRKV